jgi:hypothetical protein
VNEPRARSPRWESALALLASLATLASVHALTRAASLRAGLAPVLGAALWLVIAACAAGAAAGAALLWRARVRPGHGPGPVPALGGLLVVLVLAWGLALACAQPAQRLWAELALGLAAGLWSAWILLAGRRRGEPPRALRRLGLALVAVAASAVLAELALRAAAALLPLPLLARTHDAPRATIERFRCAPGQVHQGFACNERGFFDAPFARDGRPRAAVVGDSFGVGVVPHARHYTSVAEAGAGLEVANVGVAGCGPPEYLALLVDEVLPLEPELVVFALFAGNDLEFEAGARRGGLLHDWLARERVLLAELPGRLLRSLREGRSLAGAGAPAGDAALAPWLDEPLLEPPSLSAEAFLRLELERARRLDAADPAVLDELIAILREARDLVAPRPFAVLLIPDEFQVEDELWQALLAAAGRELERDALQQRLLPRLAAEGIPALDLLPILRAVAPLPDGRRHLYHARDTHWNARGNRVAGEALAEFLLESRR